MNIKPSTNFEAVMVDLESLGVSTRASIVSIGAVKFNLLDLDTYENLNDPNRCFYVEINQDSWFDYDQEADGPTIQWWMSQSEESRKVFKASPYKLTINSAFHQFHSFVGSKNETTGKPIELWSNGSNFDVVILRELARKILGKGEPYQVKFNSEFDVRTIVLLATKLTGFDKKTFTAQTPGYYSHNALEDAKHQVLLVQECCRRLNPNKSAIQYVRDMEPSVLINPKIVLPNVLLNTPSPEQATEALFFDDDIPKTKVS